MYASAMASNMPSRSASTWWESQSTKRSANYWWKLSLHWRSKSPWQSSRNFRRDWTKWINSAGNKWSERVYEADLAQRRYLHVDPANRLVADSLEADWNEKLRLLNEAQERYEQQRQQDRAVIDEQQRARIAALASDFPRLWSDPKTPDRERKRMVRLLLEDVTLIRQDRITVYVRFKGGASKTLTLPRPLTSWELRMTPAEVVREIDRLMDDHTDKEIVGILNARGTLSGEGKTFSSRIIARLRRDYQLKPRYDRLREKGLLTIEEISQRLAVPRQRVGVWRQYGLLNAYPANDKDAWRYEDPGPAPPRRAQGVKLESRRRFDNNGAHRPVEVQYEA